MSGGCWNYAGYKVQDLLSEIGSDTRTKERFPRLSNILIRLGNEICKMEHEMDWDFAKDSKIENDEEFETKYIDKLEDILSPKYEVHDIEEALAKLEVRMSRIKDELKIKVNTMKIDIK